MCVKILNVQKQVLSSQVSFLARVCSETKLIISPNKEIHLKSNLSLNMATIILLTENMFNYGTLNGISIENVELAFSDFYSTIVYSSVLVSMTAFFLKNMKSLQ